MAAVLSEESTLRAKPLPVYQAHQLYLLVMQQAQFLPLRDPLYECRRSHPALLFALACVCLLAVDGRYERLVFLLLMVGLVNRGHVEGLVLEGVDGASTGVVLTGLQEVKER